MGRFIIVKYFLLIKNETELICSHNSNIHPFFQRTVTLQGPANSSVVQSESHKDYTFELNLYVFYTNTKFSTMCLTFHFPFNS